jgi:glycerophosphoryl diester phosphodiesterase
MNSLLNKLAEVSTLNVAHRGARSLAPENTLPAALKALETGADLWELDVAMTAEGEPIVIHDQSLHRTSNAEQVFPSRRPWWVHEFSLEEIRCLDFGSWFEKTDPFGQIAVGMVSEGELRSYRGEPAPTLREALEFTLAHDWYVNIEIKDVSDSPSHNEIVENVVKVIESLKMADRVLISSFNHSCLKQVKAISPMIPTGVLVNRRRAELLRLVQDLRADAYLPRISALGPADVGRLREKGIPVLVWVVNDQATMRSLIKTGVSGIFTDFPQRLRPILSRRGDSRQP